jgi:predicted ATPase
MGPKVVAMAHQPVLTQIVELARQQKVQGRVRQEIEDTLREFESMRFVDFVPDAMRRPSLPGQIVLSDQGENLSSVLEGICSDTRTKEVLRSWIQELTPMDVVDFEFVADPQGKILVYLVEKSGRRISAYSASDGTLRFLGILAAFLGPKPARFYFIEEIDNGIHPARLYLLMNLLESRTTGGELQVFMTTHSPQLLRLLKPPAMPYASLTYRVEGVAETRIKSLPDIPHLCEVLETSDIARLYEGGWMEQAMFFEEGEPEPFELDAVSEDFENHPA